MDCLNVEPKQFIQFIPNNNDTRYTANIKLSNYSSKTLYFDILSTLNPCVNFTPTINHIQPNQTKFIIIQGQFKTNINYQKQLIRIHYQYEKFVKNYIHLTKVTKKITFKIVFPKSSILFSKCESMNQTLKKKAQNFYNVARSYYQVENYQQALLNYLQAIDNYKYEKKYYLQIVNAYRKLRCFQDALLMNQVFLLEQYNNIEGLIINSKIYGQICKHEQSSENKIIILQQVRQRLGLVLGYLNLKYEDRNQIQEILIKLNKIEKQIKNYDYYSLQGYLSSKLPFNNPQQFQNFKYKDSFQNLQSFNSFLHKALKQIKIQTPQHFVDPLNYQIFQNPVIIPSGISYQQKSLNQFFRYKGISDPITKIQLTRDLIFPNHNLRDLIKNNKNLKTWVNYEQLVLTSSLSEIQF